MKIYLFIPSFLLIPFLLLADTSNVWRDYEDITFHRVEVTYEEGLRNVENMHLIREDENGVLWIGGGDGGLYRFNGYAALDIKDHINRTQSNVIESVPVSFLILDKDQDLWVGSPNRLYKIRRKDLKCSKIDLGKPMYELNHRNFINRITQHKDNILVGTLNGLYIFDRASGDLLSEYLNDGVEDENIRGTSRYVKCIYPNIDPNNVWLALYDGMYKINLSTGIYEHYTADFSQPYQHRFAQGFIFEDSLIVMPSRGYGMVHFNVKSKKFSHHLTGVGTYIKDKNGLDHNYNSIRSTLALNDSIIMLTAYNIGMGLYNRHTHDYFWLPKPLILEGKVDNIFFDKYGYVWRGSHGMLFRSNRPLREVASITTKHVIDVTGVFVNGRKKGVPCLEEYPIYQLEENERNLDLIFSLTHPFVFDTIQYEYKWKNKDWKVIETPNKLSINNLSNGKNQINIRAKKAAEILAERKMYFDVFVPIYKRTWFYVLSVVALLATGVGVARFRINQVRKEERLKAGFEKKLAEIESMALRSQINPHFIFNTLNSIKYYAIKKNPSETGEFINHFSALIRQILENSKKNLISLREEIETLSNYIEVEKMRFRDAFKSHIEVNPSIDQDFFMIPPSLLQPFVENSIWHGLMHKEGEKRLEVIFRQDQDTIFCEIIDNGIGREAAAKIHKNRSHKNSLGMSITAERIEHLQAVHGIKSDFEIIDLYDNQGNAAGTKVVVSFST